MNLDVAATLSGAIHLTGWRTVAPITNQPCLPEPVPRACADWRAER